MRAKEYGSCAQKRHWTEMHRGALCPYVSKASEAGLIHSFPKSAHGVCDEKISGGKVEWQDGAYVMGCGSSGNDRVEL